MSITMRSGKRLLAVVAAGALGVGMLTFVAAQPAQAAGVVGVWCSGGSAVTVPGNPGIAPDPTTVSAGCSVPSGANNRAFVSLTGFTQPAYYELTLSGLDAVWVDDTTSFVYTRVNAGTGLLSPDKKTFTVLASTMTARAVGATPTNAADPQIRLMTSAAGQVTVSVSVSTAANINLVNTNKQLQGTFDVKAYGPPVALKNVTLNHAIPPKFNEDPFGALTPVNTTWVSALVAVDAAGNFYPLNPTLANFTTDPGTVQFVQTPGSNRDVLAFSGAPTAAGTVDPFAVGVRSLSPASGTRLLGTNNFSVELLVTNPGLTASGSYVVSSTLGAKYTATFNKAEYNRGETATLTVCATDLGGLIVPDGLDWEITTAGDPDTVSRNMKFDFNVETVVPAVNNFEISQFTAAVDTVNGCDSYVIEMPESNVDFKVGLTPLTTGATAGWTAVNSGPASVTVKVGTGGSTPPPPVTIMIVGERGKGENANRVFVEGTTTGFGGVGGTVTPYFRFPGETGFTQGTGVRSVDAQGNFAWQRQTGKQIAVQFRSGDVRSNSVIIPAK